MNALDNGFLRLDRVRIPRRQMLMRFSRLDRDGTYAKPAVGSDKLAYLGMVGIRAGIVNTAGMLLARAVTVAIRYSLVRRQFGEPLERQVLDYRTQQLRLFVPLAAAYAMTATGRYMHQMHLQLEKSLRQGNAEALPEVHATSAGLCLVLLLFVS
jgi:acyl-CoA oxidase